MEITGVISFLLWPRGENGASGEWVIDAVGTSKQNLIDLMELSVGASMESRPGSLVWKSPL